jgi:hypothetical protein
MNILDPVLMNDDEIKDTATHYTQKDRATVRRIKCAVQLREPHLTAQLSQYNAIVDDRFDWDAQVEAAA